MAGEQLEQSPLHARHQDLGAKFAEFGGWEMPVEYVAGVVQEHRIVRQAVGVFDVSHLGKLVVSGPGAAALVNRTLSNDLAKISPGQAQYTLCCAADGGIVDDLIVYLEDDERLLLVPNAANSAEVARRLREAAPDAVTVADQHEAYAIIAVQGPASAALLDAAGLSVDLAYMSFVECGWSDGSGPEVRVVVCRTGYTGERGYEVIVARDAAGALWDALLREGVQFGALPCGLGARDTLRTEMGYPLHGQDITPATNPVEAGIGWAVGWKKPEFWGRDALLTTREAAREAGSKGRHRRRLTGIVATGRGIPRPGMSVSLTEHIPLGEVTSGTFSPTLRKGIGLVYVPADIEDGVEVGVDVRGRREIFTLVHPPFVDTSVKET